MFHAIQYFALYKQEGTQAAYVTLCLLAPCRLLFCDLTYCVDTVCAYWFPSIFGCNPTWLSHGPHRESPSQHSSHMCIISET